MTDGDVYGEEKKEESWLFNECVILACFRLGESFDAHLRMANDDDGAPMSVDALRIPLLDEAERAEEGEVGLHQTSKRAIVRKWLLLLLLMLLIATLAAGVLALLILVPTRTSTGKRHA